MRDRWLRIICIPLMSIIFPMAFYPVSHPRFPLAVLSTFITMIAAWELNRFFIIRLRQWLRYEQYPILHIFIQILVTVFLSTILLQISFFLTYKYLYHDAIDKAIFERSIGIAIIVTLLINAVYESLYFSTRWRVTFLKAEVLRRENLRSQFESLKNQVNPHFLFNSLNTLTTLIEEDKALALRFVKELAGVYRYVLDSRDWELVSLEKELHFMKTYIFLLQMRFGNNLMLEIDLKEEDKNTAIPPLTLQILAENAVKHNIISREKPLIFRICSANHKQIIVRNNLQKKTLTQRSSTHVGLSNIIERYRYLADEPVVIHETDQTFEVKLPLIAGSALRKQHAQ